MEKQKINLQEVGIFVRAQGTSASVFYGELNDKEDITHLAEIEMKDTGCSEAYKSQPAQFILQVARALEDLARLMTVEYEGEIPLPETRKYVAIITDENGDVTRRDLTKEELAQIKYRNEVEEYRLAD